ncbi:hypothetical protein HPP92_017122 [Vanilla planifolia]|uniref:Uncharacterized protein n=1 Tax=Vanilla planifolia TaxID=51239 RepID=A0A835UQM7_VANPL|nr:hypothetical protein HPP92_017122 [Vanilla planifolia]
MFVTYKRLNSRKNLQKVLPKVLSNKALQTRRPKLLERHPRRQQENLKQPRGPKNLRNEYHFCLRTRGMNEE